MAKDLFQVSTERDIYLTMDLWAMLSPRLAQRESNKSPESKNNHGFQGTNIEERRNSDVDQSC